MDLLDDGQEDRKPLLRRRRPMSRENSSEEESQKPRPLHLDFVENIQKRKASDISYSEQLKLDLDDNLDVSEKEFEEHSLEKDGLLKKKITFFGLIASELTRGYSLQHDQERYIEKRRKVYAFLHVPIELEKFLFFGFLQCLDAFCYVFTMLPIRCILSVFRIGRWSHANTCDFLKVFIIIFSSYLMQFVDTSRLYHIVRGQGVIKLYIFYNMLEVADKLFSSFGQDVLDALMWTATEKEGKRKFLSSILHLFFAIAYASSHAFLVLLQATTLNVAFNSQSQSLLTILISNNFVELKGSVFKKFAKPNLFQMSCSDVRERFHLMILLIFVILRNMTANHWRLDHLSELLPDLMVVVLSEILVDALKHAFITKFNDINFEVYKDFTITLAFDVDKSRDERAFSDFADQVSRRMGFIPIPISIMLIRTITQSIDFKSHLATMFITLTWVSLLTIKVVNGHFLYNKSADHINEYRNIQRNEEFLLYRKRMLASKSKSVPSSPKMSLIDFNDVLTQAGYGGGFTVSDFLPHIDELRRLRNDTEQIISEPSPTPRRSVSMMDFSVVQNPRESSHPPTIPENDERLDETPENQSKDRSQQSPRRKVPAPLTPARECESLEKVQAFKMPDCGETVQEIRS
ncbi:hypothetical protein FO519_003788 [Halicephalobus sp. NKZ332]|nr:hypothetical protein FO519_003788 [Halicephalobus sp. NKZ332]